jgi:hypothetical protein
MSRYQEHTLLASQQDAVFEVVRGEGFDPSEFHWSSRYGDVYGGSVPSLFHVPTGSEFIFDFDPQYGQHCPEWSPGEQQPRDKAPGGDWRFMYAALSHWLENIERERSSPNLWAELNKQRELFAATEPSGRQGDESNAPFTAEEQAQVATQLNEIKEVLVQNHQADRRALESRIEYLREASTRMGRRDWLNIFVGTIFSWALTGLAPPEGVREVLALAAHGLGHLFGGGVPQLPIA